MYVRLFMNFPKTHHSTTPLLDACHSGRQLDRRHKLIAWVDQGGRSRHSWHGSICRLTGARDKLLRGHVLQLFDLIFTALAFGCITHVALSGASRNHGPIILLLHKFDRGFQDASAMRFVHQAKAFLVIFISPIAHLQAGCRQISHATQVTHTRKTNWVQICSSRIR